MGLRRFGPTEVASYLERGENHARAPGPADLVHQKTERNLIFVREPVQWLRSHADGRIESDEFEIPATLQQLIERHLADATGQCTRILKVASVVVRKFDAQVVPLVAQLTKSTVLEGLVEPEVKHFIEAKRGSPGPFASPTCCCATFSTIRYRVRSASRSTHCWEPTWNAGTLG